MIVAITIEILIALIHILRLGHLFSGELYNIYYSYFSDLILPFGTYLLLTMNESQCPSYGDGI